MIRVCPFVIRFNLVYRCFCFRSSPEFAYRDTYWWNTEIMKCFKCGDAKTASQLFDEMPDKNTVTWNCMISGYVRNWKIEEARKIFDVMPYRNVVSWTALLNGYAKCGRLGEARALFDSMLERNVVCWNTMISGYVSHGRLGEARDLFDAMPARNSVSWATMIEGYCQHSLLNKAQDLFEQVNIHAAHVCNAMLSGYVNMGHHDKASKLFNQIPHRDIVSWTTMIMSHLQAGKIEKARSLFEEMPKKDVAVWTAMVQGYLQDGDIKEARRLFNDMPYRDIVAWNLMISGYIQNKMFDDALELFMSMPERDIVSWNSILQGYVQQDDIITAQEFFEKMLLKDGTSWNIMLSGNQKEEALVIYCKMIGNGFQPDQGTFGSVISTCGALAMLGFGRAVHLSVIKTGFEQDKVVMSSLITMYSKCGSVNDAVLVFEGTGKQDTVTWNAMIAAKAYHGSAAEAFDLYSLMLKAGFAPDHVTFLGLLTACAHGGLVDKAWECFTSMEQEWRLHHKPAHCACMVDLLGRSGLLNEAVDFIKHRHLDIPMHTLETLLSACRVHGNFKLGETVAKEILSVQPENGSANLLLSKMYAARGMWKDAAGVRELIKSHGAKKEPACSWIEMKGKMCSSCIMIDLILKYITYTKC
ncbi:hypothetical protein Sjap_004035 [Stephania japonica]|uniref:Chlororespiratory reduction 4 n=1 Tax=Stephania japonica TaxID=461633 RepID=A0AAP0K1I7_9MAGN